MENRTQEQAQWADVYKRLAKLEAVVNPDAFQKRECECGPVCDHGYSERCNCCGALDKPAPEPEKCGCGLTWGTIHRFDGPCYVVDKTVPESAKPFLAVEKQIEKLMSVRVYGQLLRDMDITRLYGGGLEHELRELVRLARETDKTAAEPKNPVPEPKCNHEIRKSHWTEIYLPDYCPKCNPCRINKCDGSCNNADNCTSCRKKQPHCSCYKFKPSPAVDEKIKEIRDKAYSSHALREWIEPELRELARLAKETK